MPRCRRTARVAAPTTAGSPDATSKRIIPSRADRDHLGPVLGEEDVEVARLLRAVEAAQLGAGVRVDDADRTDLRADGQVAIGGERDRSRRRCQVGAPRAGQSCDLAEQLARRAVTDLNPAPPTSADDDDRPVVADRHRSGPIRDAHRVESTLTRVHVPDGQQAELGPGSGTTRPPQRREVAPLLVRRRGWARRR